MPNLLDLLKNQIPQQPGLAPLPTGNIGASPSPLALGSMVAQNDQIDPKLAQALRSVFGSPTPQNSATPSPAPHVQHVPQVNPFSNFANKATGKSYK